MSPLMGRALEPFIQLLKSNFAQQLTERILDIKRQQRLTWKQITDEIAGMSPVLVVGALLGQMKGCPTSRSRC